MDNINDIISNLTQEDIDMLKGVAASVLSGGAENQKGETSREELRAKNLPSTDFDGIDFDMVMKAKRIFEKMNSANNKNLDLINALKPHLSVEKQQRADQAVRILKLFEVLPLLKELF